MVKCRRVCPHGINNGNVRDYNIHFIALSLDVPADTLKDFPLAMIRHISKVFPYFVV